MAQDQDTTLWWCCGTQAKMIEKSLQFIELQLLVCVCVCVCVFYLFIYFFMPCAHVFIQNALLGEKTPNISRMFVTFFLLVILWCLVCECVCSKFFVILSCTYNAKIVEYSYPSFFFHFSVIKCRKSWHYTHQQSNSFVIVLTLKFDWYDLLKFAFTNECAV
jgi:hypothetical protein